MFTLLFTFLAFAIAQFGLMAVVSKGYSYLGYAAFDYVVYSICAALDLDERERYLRI